jgi:uncharacterized membrane protein required for colicin V production
MNIIDLVLLLVVLLCLISGWRKGFIAGILDLAGWLGSLVIGFFAYKYLAVFLEKYFTLGAWTYPVSFLVTIIFARVILSIITNRIVYSAPEHVHLSWPNRLLGLFPGFITGVIYAALLSALLLGFPFATEISNQSKQSKLVEPLAMQVDWLDEKIAPIFNDAIHHSVNKITLHPKSNETVVLPFKVTDAVARPDLEAQMLVLVNKERAKAGLKALQPDPLLTNVARQHSTDMFVRGYFSHFSPEGKTSADRIKAARIPYQIAGENLALGQTLSICHNGLMNSPGHRANILEKRYGRLGIGILDGGRRGLMVTQNFRN